MIATTFLQKVMAMKGSSLFRSRLIRGWKFQYNVWKTVLDWTVMLYIVIPAVVISTMIYRSWWQETPSWIMDLPLFLLFFAFYVIAWSGSIHMYLEEADKVFLVKKINLLWKLKTYGYSYSLFSQSLAVGSGFLFLLPFLLNHYQIGFTGLFALLGYFVSLSACLMLVKYYLRTYESRRKKIGIGFLLFVLFSWFSQLVYFLFQTGHLLLVYLVACVILAPSVYFSLKTLQKASSLDIGIDVEQERKTSMIKLVFSAAPEIEKPVVTRRKKPLLFRKSKRIFKKRTPVTGIAELFIKVFIRNYSYISGYAALTNVTTAAIILIPSLWIRAFLFLCFPIMINSWISIVWDKIFNSNPMTKKHIESSHYFTAKKRVTATMTIIAVTLLLLFGTVGSVLLAHFQ
jgi:ABC-2 type transport system permease protein